MLKAIIKGCKKEQAAQQRALFEQLAPLMMTVVRRYTNHRTDAEDILQEAFVKVFHSFGKYDEEKGPVEAWVRRIVVNTAIQHWRRWQKNNPFVAVAETLPDVPVSAEADLLIDEEQLLTLIAGLAPGFRMVFNLYAIEGYSHAEIAETLQITESASRSQLARARKQLQAALTTHQSSDHYERY